MAPPQVAAWYNGDRGTLHISYDTKWLFWTPTELAAASRSVTIAIPEITIMQPSNTSEPLALTVLLGQTSYVFHFTNNTNAHDGRDSLVAGVMQALALNIHRSRPRSPSPTYVTEPEVPASGRIARMKRNQTANLPLGVFGPRVTTTSKGHRITDGSANPPPAICPPKVVFPSLAGDPADDVFSTPATTSHAPPTRSPSNLIPEHRGVRKCIRRLSFRSCDRRNSDSRADSKLNVEEKTYRGREPTPTVYGRSDLSPELVRGFLKVEQKIHRDREPIPTVYGRSALSPEPLRGFSGLHVNEIAERRPDMEAYDSPPEREKYRRKSFVYGKQELNAPVYGTSAFPPPALSQGPSGLSVENIAERCSGMGIYDAPSEREQYRGKNFVYFMKEPDAVVHGRSALFSAPLRGRSGPSVDDITERRSDMDGFDSPIEREKYRDKTFVHFMEKPNALVHGRSPVPPALPRGPPKLPVGESTERYCGMDGFDSPIEREKYRDKSFVHFMDRPNASVHGRPPLSHALPRGPPKLPVGESTERYYGMDGFDSPLEKEKYRRSSFVYAPLRGPSGLAAGKNTKGHYGMERYESPLEREKYRQSSSAYAKQESRPRVLDVKGDPRPGASNVATLQSEVSHGFSQLKAEAEIRRLYYKELWRMEEACWRRNSDGSWTFTGGN